MTFRQPVCKLQLIIKDRSIKHKKNSPLKHQQHPNNQSPPSKWNLPTYSKSHIIQQALQVDPTGRVFPYDEPKSMIKMMSRMMNSFKEQEKNKKSFRRSQSAPRVKKHYFQSSQQNQKSQPQRFIQSKGVQQKEVNSQDQLIKSMEKREEEDIIIVQHTSAHDLKNRQTHQRSKTARDTIKHQRTKSSKMSPTKSVVLSARKNSRVMSINPAQQYENQYRKKLKNYLDYIFKVNFSNGIYIQLNLKPVDIDANMHKYKIYVGKGNNSNLIRQLLKRRFWYQVIQNMQSDCVAYWSTFPLKNVIARQKQMRSPQQQIYKSNQRQIQNLKKQFQFRKEMIQSKETLNSKIMGNEQAERVEQLILQKGYSIFTEPYNFECLTNHIPGISCLSVRKNLFRNIKTYFQDVIDEDPYSIMPKTFHFTEFKGYEIEFFKHIATTDPKKLWIIKPGENSSKTAGIQILPASKILPKIKERWFQDDEKWTFIVQSYIQTPLLYYNRKFDIRHFVLLTCINGRLKAFWYREGYMRTSCKDFPLVTKINCRNPQAKKFKNQFNEQQGQWLKKKEVHFTNDSIQSEEDDYGKFQPGNKLSYGDFQKFLDYEHAEFPFYGKIVSKMKQIALSVLKSVKGKIDPHRRACNMELLAFDYLMDEDYNVWLMKVKNNPSLDTSSSVLLRVIPGIIQQMIRFTVDPLFPPRNHFPAREKHTIPTDNLAALKFQIFYEE